MHPTQSGSVPRPFSRLAGIHLPGALAVFERNLRVWLKLLGAAVVLNFGEPLIYLLGLGLGLGMMLGEVGGMSYLAFLASGIVASAAMNTASFEGTYSVYTRMVPQKTYEALLATPLGLEDIVAGEMLWAAAKAAFSGLAILVVATALGAVSGWMALLTLPVVFLTGLAFAGPAMWTATRAGNYDFFNYYFVLVLTPTLLLSGVFFPTDTMPMALQWLMQLLPLIHAIELIRPLFQQVWPEQAWQHLIVLLLWAWLGYCATLGGVQRRLIV